MAESYEYTQNLLFLLTNWPKLLRCKQFLCMEQELIVHQI